MTEGYAAYPEYKDSGMEWIGSIPTHWKTAALSKLFSIKAGGDLKTKFYSEEKTETHPYPIYTNANDENAVYGYTSRSNYTPGSITVSGRGEVGFATYRNHAYDAIIRLLVLTPISTISGKFFAYFINEVLDFRVESSAIGQLSTQQISPYKVAFPLFEEQQKIADFLDHETAKIDTLIEKQQQLITLLKEKRQALISHAVTKGLNPDAPMRDSGVEWLEEVPEHWVVMPLKRAITGMEQGKSPECESREASIGEWGVLKTSCVNNAIYNEQENKSLPKNITPFTQYEVKKGDVLMSRASGSIELIGSVAYVHETKGQILLSDKVFRLHLKKSMDRLFFSYLMQSSYVRLLVEQSISGAEGMANNITKTAVLGFYFAKPTLSEQQEISQHLRDKLKALQKVSSLAVQQVKFLQERRAVLISAAVTGKIDVRNWQSLRSIANEPEEAVA